MKNQQMDKGQVFRGFSAEFMEARCRGRMFQRRVEIVSDFLRGLNLPSGSRVLEIGSGTGQVMDEMARRNPGLIFIGIEPARSYVDYARERYGRHNTRLCYELGCLEEHALAAASVQAAYSVNVWHHIEEERLEDAARNLAAACAEAACCLLLEPNYLHPYIFGYQTLAQGERNFLPGRELEVLERYFIEKARKRYFLFPEFMRALPPALQEFERRFEGGAFLSGAVAHIVQKRGT